MGDILGMNSTTSEVSGGGGEPAAYLKREACGERGEKTAMKLAIASIDPRVWICTSAKKYRRLLVAERHSDVGGERKG